MNINRKDTEAKWYKYKNGVEVKIRPFKLTKGTFSGKIMTDAKEKFMYSLMDWKGINDVETNKPFECNTKNKEYIMDYYDELGAFVLTTITELLKRLEDSIKN